MKIGSYTWHKGVPVYDSDLLKYFHTCIDNVLKKQKWWKQAHSTKEIKITIEINKRNHY